MNRRLMYLCSLTCFAITSCAPDIVVSAENGNDPSSDTTLSDTTAADGANATTDSNGIASDVATDAQSDDAQTTPEDTAQTTDIAPADTDQGDDTSPTADAGGAPCTTTDECPTTPCRVGVCEAGQCVFQQLLDGVACQQSDPCMAPGTCNDGECEASPISCDDGDECTNDVCIDGECTNTVICCSGTDPCDDGDPNTKDDTCDGNGICVGTPIICPETTTCITAYVPNGSDCVPSYAIAGTDCDDNDQSTAGDICNGQGECKGSSPECPTPTGCISEYISDGTTCVALNTPAGTPCMDGDETTENDQCDGAGNCSGTPIICPPTTNCTAAWSITNENCVPNYSPAGTTCDDADNSTKDDVCNGSGTCSGIPITCDPPSQCVNSYTTDGQGCVAEFTMAGTSCDDGDATTSNDVCDGAGTCEGSPFGCPGPTLCTPSWTPNGNGCTPNHAAPNTSCNDGDNATANDVCDGQGGCAGTPIVCPATTPCISSYTTNGSTCTPVYATAGTQCNDGSNATKNDVCNGAGSCLGTPYSCPPSTICITGYTQDGVGCNPTYATTSTVCSTPSGNCFTGGTCNGSGTCLQETPKPNGTACGDSSNSICDLADSCLNGQCVPNYVPQGTTCATATSQCTTSSLCNGSGVCTPGMNQPDGTACGDSQDTACSNPDTCQNGTCQPNHAPQGTACGTASSDCVNGGTCNGSGGCTSETPKPNGTACGDSSSTTCTAPDTCLNGTCQSNHSPAGTICGQASNDCRNAPKCNASGTCLPETSKANGSTCGNTNKSKCSDPDTCLNGQCNSNHLANGTSCGDVTWDCKLPQCTNGTCANNASAVNGTQCPYSSDQGQTISAICGTCSSGTCEVTPPLNGFCHDGPANAVCNDTVLYQCLPCPEGTQPCIINFPDPF